MNFESTEIEIKESEIETFRAEIAGIKENPDCEQHLKFIDPNKLGYEELEIYTKFKGGTLTEADIKAYNSTVVSPRMKGKGFREIIDDPLSNFYGWMLNELLDKQAKEKNKK